MKSTTGLQINLPYVCHLKRRRTFDSQPGTKHVATSIELIDIFELTVTDKIVNNIVYYTNLYFRQPIGNKEIKNILGNGQKLLLLKYGYT